MLHGAELAGGGRPASLLARRPTRTAAVAGKGTSSPCEHQLAWAGLAKASSRHRALRSPTPSFPPFPFVTGGATVAAFLHSELAPRPLPFHVPSPTFACVPLARAWRAAQRQAERRRRHGRSAAASTRRAEARQASRQRPEWHRAAPHRPPGCCEHPPLSAPARGPQCGSSPAACDPPCRGACRRTRPARRVCSLCAASTAADVPAPLSLPPGRCGTAALALAVDQTGPAAAGAAADGAAPPAVGCGPTHCF